MSYSTQTVDDDCCADDRSKEGSCFPQRQIEDVTLIVTAFQSLASGIVLPAIGSSNPLQPIAFGGSDTGNHSRKWRETAPGK